MGTEKNDELIRRLCSQLEAAVGRKLRTPKDFKQLCNMVEARTGEQLSYNTMRRAWGIVGGNTRPRRFTLSILARFLGYHDWDGFVAANSVGAGGEEADKEKSISQLGNDGKDASTPLVMRHIDVPTELRIGDRLRLTWQPGRVCDVEYDGSLHFRVLASQKTRLQPGDTFLCSLIVDGEPLYLGVMQKPNQPPVTYVCGKISGVRFERLKTI